MNSVRNSRSRVIKVRKSASVSELVVVNFGKVRDKVNEAMNGEADDTIREKITQRVERPHIDCVKWEIRIAQRFAESF